MFAGSGGLQFLVALVAGQHTQGATQYTKKDAYYKQFGMEMSQLKESFWRQKEKRRNDFYSGDRKKSDGTMMQPTKPNSNGKVNETKKYMLHDLKTRKTRQQIR